MSKTNYEYDSMHCDDEYADEIQALNVFFSLLSVCDNLKSAS